METLVGPYTASHGFVDKCEDEATVRIAFQAEQVCPIVHAQRASVPTLFSATPTTPRTGSQKKSDAQSTGIPSAENREIHRAG
jgi:hypothetical protein